MTISLIELGTVGLSLEFEEADMPRVISAIHALFGKMVRTPYVMASEIAFGGASFIYQNEWNDPCLISRSAEGDDCLRRLHAELTSPAGSGE